MSEGKTYLIVRMRSTEQSVSVDCCMVEGKLNDG